jgi:hypothetical protein
MEHPSFVYMLIEAVIFLIPICALFIKLGEKSKVIDNLEERTKGYPEWKAGIDVKVTQLELNDIEQNKTLVSINDNLVKISTQVQLLLDNKIKMESNCNE